MTTTKLGTWMPLRGTQWLARVGYNCEWHRVTVDEPGLKMSKVTFWDNARRGETFKHGRVYNHGTRGVQLVWNTDLKPLPNSERKDQS